MQRRVAAVVLTAAVAIAVTVQEMARKRAEGDSLGEVLLVAGRLNVNTPFGPVANSSSLPALEGKDASTEQIPNEKPSEFTLRAHTTLAKVAEMSAPKETFERTFDGLVRYTEFARRALGEPCPPALPTCVNHWLSLSAGEKEEVTDLLRQVLQQRAWMNREHAQLVEVDGDALERKKGLWAVRARYVRSASAVAVHAEYLIDGTPHDRRAVDVVIEGSMMSKNYYVQFDRMLRTPAQGYAYMVGKLQSKLGKMSR
jgi:hypothetical protein